MYVCSHRRNGPSAISVDVICDGLNSNRTCVNNHDRINANTSNDTAHHNIYHPYVSFIKTTTAATAPTAKATTAPATATAAATAAAAAAAAAAATATAAATTVASAAHSTIS